MAKPYNLSTPDVTKYKEYYRDQVSALWYMAIVAYRYSGVTYYDGVIREVHIQRVADNARMVSTSADARHYRETLNTAPRQSGKALEVAQGEFFEMVHRFKDSENLELEKHPIW